MIFGKKKSADQAVEEQRHNNSLSQNEQPKRGKFRDTGVGKVVDDLGEKVQEIRTKWNKISMFVSVLSVLFFTLFSIVGIWKEWGQSKLFPVIVVGTALYVIVFVVYTVVTTVQSKNVKKGLKDFKSTMKYWKLAMNLLFLVLNVLVFANSWQSYKLQDGFLPILTMLASGSLLLCNLFVTVVKLITHTIFDKMRRNRDKKRMQKKGR
ncbi:MAG: hypothetical protein IKC52_06510 [Clostridia bacterium]|nr:hypothetical protein [Clostridia bacterium]